jgi:hypothetical protein
MANPPIEACSWKEFSMNFVKQILDELSGDTLGKLGSLLGMDDETAESAVSAAAPSLLAGLASLATQSDGTRKLTSALGEFDESSWGNFGELLGGDASALFQKGGNLLTNLFNATLLNGLSNAVAKFAGINSGTARNLLAYLAPMVLGKISALWRSRGGDASALTSFMAEQKENIVEAMPAGFSLADVPGLARFGDTARAAGRRPQAATPSVASWAVPLALLLVAGFLLWNYMQPRQDAAQAARDAAERTTAMKPVVPETTTSTAAATELTDRLQDIIRSAGETLGKIDNAATAEAVKPQLDALNKSLDSSLTMLGNLPEIGKNMVHRFTADQLGPIKEQIERVGRITGMSDEIKELIVTIVKKFQQLSGELKNSP